MRPSALALIVFHVVLWLNGIPQYPGQSLHFFLKFFPHCAGQIPSSLFWQPQVITIEGDPGHMAYASLSFPNGSVWCGGAPTYWIVGHQRLEESPYCEVAPDVWQMSTTTALDTTDEMNGADLDRHDCSTMDVNRDGLTDVICAIGANQGTDVGYNELYFTQPDGSLLKMQRDHGLQKYPTMRTRHTAVLKNKDGEEEFIFISTHGVERVDGRPNRPRMFRNNFTHPDILPYFEEVDGPWTTVPIFVSNCAVSGDYTHDGLDDLVVCSRYGPSLLVRQLLPLLPNDDDAAAETLFRQVHIEVRQKYMDHWRNVRIADVTGDGLPDLVVVTFPSPTNMLYIFRGTTEPPWFDFIHVYMELTLPYGAPDVEILDVNSDNVADLYVVQVNEQKGIYCEPGVGQDWWGNTTFPPADWKPPLDVAPDLLLVGSPLDPGRLFYQESMEHAMPGCGWLAQRFDDQTMLLGQGTVAKTGHSLLLKWHY